MQEITDSIPMRRPVPFYGSYASFLRAMRALKDNGIPRCLNPRSLAPILGDEAPRIVTGFVSMGWIDESGRPTNDFVNLVESYGGDSWKTALTGIVRSTYSFVPGKWEDLTADALHEAFIVHTGREAKVIMSAETFFLSLALECGINLSDRLYLRALRAHNEAKRLKDEDDLEVEKTEQETIAVPVKPHQQPMKAVKEVAVLQKGGGEWVDHIVKLSALLAEGDMTEQEKSAVVVLLSYLGRRLNSASAIEA